MLIFTFNESANLGACLDALTWCSDVHVVDSGSSDSTIEIARRHGALIHTHHYLNHTKQLEWALKAIPFQSDWLMFLDADNVVTEQLRDQIMIAMDQPSGAVAGFYTRYKQFFRGRPVRGLKSMNLSLFRRSAVRVDPSESVDFRFVLDGTTALLTGAVLHSNAKEADIDFWLIKHLKFSSRAAVEEVLRRSGRLEWSFRPRLLGNADERITWLKQLWYRMPLFFRPFLYFVYRYFLRFGFLDGFNGFIFHFLQAFWYRLLIDIKMVEIYRRIGSGTITMEELLEQHAGRSSIS